jgi:hypothetical protein
LLISTSGSLGDQADRRKIAKRVVGQVAIEMRIDRHRAVDHHHQRVTVGGRLGELPGRDPAVSRWLVLDDDRLMHRGREPVGDGARDQVEGAARRVVTTSWIGFEG